MSIFDTDVIYFDSKGCLESYASYALGVRLENNKNSEL